MSLLTRFRRESGTGTIKTGVLAGGLLAAVLLLIAIFATIRLASIASDLRHARSLIESASQDVEQGRLGPARASLLEAQESLTSTNGDLYGQPELDLVGWIPGVSDNLDSLKRSVSLALQMVDGGNRLLEITRPLENAEGKLEISMNHGEIPLKAVQDAELEARALAAVLPPSAEKPSRSRLIGPIADLQDRLFAEAGRRRAQLDNVSRALSIMADMSGGNGFRRYLIAVANTAEMRGTGGMILSYGVLEASNGTFTLGNFGPIDDLAIDQPVDATALDLPADYLTRWQDLQPTRLWRNVNLSPDFAMVAPVMEAMATNAAFLPANALNGVIQIDPAGLAAILQGTGPVQVEGVGEVSAENVVDLTINRAYIDFPNRDQRQEVSADVAEAAFRALIDGEFASLRPFGDALFKAAAARHLIFHSDAPDIAPVVGYFGADGALVDPAFQDSFLMTVQNVGQNKLDYYVDTGLSLTGTRPARDAGSLTATISVTNSTPEGIGSEYITGAPVQGRPYALYSGIVSLYVPTGTTLAGYEGSDASPSVTTEGGRTLVTFDVAVPPGGTSSVSLNLSLVPRPPGRPYTVILIPVGRVRPTTVAVDIDLLTGRRVQAATSPLEKVVVLSAGAGG